MVEPSWILRPIPDLREKLEMREKEIEFRNFLLASPRWRCLVSDCVLLGVAHRDRDLPQLGLSKSPVEPRSFALLVVLQDHSRRRRRSFCSRSMHGSSTDTRASRYDLWAQSANYIGRTSANQAYKRQNLRLDLSRPPTSVGSTST